MLDNLLIITGLYMSIRQFKTHHHPIREKKQKTSFYYRYYIYNSLFLLVASGLPWSGFMGNQIYKIASSNESLGYPKLYMAPPESKVKNCRGQQEKAPPESNSNESKAISVHELQKELK